MSTIGLAACAVLSFGLAADDDKPPAGAPAKPNPSRAEKRPELEPAKKELAEAAKLKRDAASRPPAEKLAMLMAAAKAYEKVAADFTGEPSVAADANFRAGEILRSIKHDEEARRAFAAAAAGAEEAPTVAARAWIELGHLERREKKLDEALRCYSRVLAIRPEPRREAATALTWQGKTLCEQKNDQDGHAALLAVGERFPEFPLDDVRNVDRVALDWIEAGRVAEARKLVEECVERHSQPEPGEESVDAAVAHALERMKSREKLAEPAADAPPKHESAPKRK
jgi:tetratricopeptide (TPR) repeat protein